jgi:coatomer subunit beta
LPYRPPLRGFLLDGDFFVAASLATTLTKIALRYVALVQEKKKQNVSLFILYFLISDY